MAAIRRGTRSTWNTSRLESAAMGVRDMNFACFPAIRAVVLAVGTEPDALHSVAVAAVAVASALSFRLIALRTENGIWHVSPRKP